MKNNFKRILLISAIALLTMGLGGVAITLTIAGYERRQPVIDPTKMPATNLTITGEGQRLTRYYLDAGIWKSASDSYNSYWALVFVYNGGTPTTLKYIHGVADGDNYHFDIDRTEYDRIQFFRTSPSNDSTLTNSTTYTDSYYTDATPTAGYAINSSDQKEFESGKSTYQITGWDGGTGVGVKNSAGYWR